jgi:hypothetical protein
MADTVVDLLRTLSANEARIAELETALRNITDLCDGFNSRNPDYRIEALVKVARKALKGE